MIVLYKLLIGLAFIAVCGGTAMWMEGRRVARDRWWIAAFCLGTWGGLLWLASTLAEG